MPAITDSIKVSLSEDVKSTNITFKYTNKVETDKSATFTLTPSLLNNYVTKNNSWHITSQNANLLYLVQY